MDARSLKNGEFEYNDGNEIYLDSIEALDKNFMDTIMPGIRAYENKILQEFPDAKFDNFVLEKRGIIYELRILGASEDS